LKYKTHGDGALIKGDGALIEMEENLIGMAKGVISALALIILGQVYMIF
jgi:hypothetical protein